MMNNYKTKKLSTSLKGVLFVVFLLSGSMLWAQSASYTISGKITGATSMPVIGATVQIEGSSAGTISDIEGFYSFSVSLAPGEYLLTVRSVGYVSASQNLSRGDNREVTADLVYKVIF